MHLLGPRYYHYIIRMKNMLDIANPTSRGLINSSIREASSFDVVLKYLLLSYYQNT